MKRIVTLTLALIMCMSVFSAFAISANADSTQTILIQENFDGTLVVPGDGRGVRPLNWSGNLENKDGKLELSNVGTTAGSIIDIQMWNMGSPVNKKITQDFVLSITFKLTGDWGNSVNDFWGFRKAKNSTSTAYANFFWIKNNKFNMQVDGSTNYAVSDVDFFADYQTVDWVFKKTGDVFTQVECWINGEIFGVKTFDLAHLDAIDHFRIFRATADGCGMSVESLTLATGTTPLYDGDLRFYDVEFDNYTSAGANTCYDNLKLTNIKDNTTTSIVDGKYIIGEGAGEAKAFDIRPYESTKSYLKALTEDFSLTMRFKLVGDWSDNLGGIIRFRDNANGKNPGSGWYNFFRINNNKLQIEESANVYKTSPVDLSASYAEVTWAFHKEDGYFKTVDCYVNGVLLGTRVFENTDTALINHFRVFDNASVGEGISVDYIKIYKGAGAFYTAPTEKTEYIGYQTTTKGDDGLFNLRLLAVMNDTDISEYTKVGFKVKATYADVEMNNTQDITEVYNKIVATTENAYKEYTAANLAGSYIFALNCIGIPADKGVITFEVTTYYQIGDGATVEEETVVFTVDPADIA